MDRLSYIPYVNIGAQHARLKDELLAAVSDVLDHGQFVLGKEVEVFESRFAELSNTRFAVSVNSGTDALVLSLRALGIGPEHEVITVPNSFVASASCIALTGAKPVFVDVREDYNINPGLIQEAITPATKAILPVHLTGRPADMDPVLDIAERHGLFVVEDCAQAVLAECGGRRVGSIGDLGCFSLHPLKTLNACGDGGVITTDDEVLCEKLRMLRNIGHVSRDEVAVWSGNSRLDTLQAAMLLVKMQYVEAWTEKRREHASAYRRGLSDVPGVRIPDDHPDRKAVYHTLVVECDGRDELKAVLANAGIGTAVHYPRPIHLQPAARDGGYGPGSFPVTETQADRILSLPVYPELKPEDVERIVQEIRGFYRGQAA
jgi:dTDP-4-amino-4,6-dideoxygalactose transaminase